MADEPMLPGRPYLLKIGTKTVRRDDHAARSTRSTSIRWSTSRPEPLELNEIGVCNIELDQPVAFDPYDETATPAASS